MRRKSLVTGLVAAGLLMVGAQAVAASGTTGGPLVSEGISLALEHDPQKWKPLLRQDHAQAVDLARVLFDQVIPPGRNAL
jgi:hypothetical protein